VVAVKAGKPAAAKRTQPVEAETRHELVSAVLESAGLADSVAPEDVLSVHLGVRSIGIRRRVRGRTGRIVHGHTLTTSHDVIPEPLED
jgi:hypothetical protein